MSSILLKTLQNSKRHPHLWKQVSRSTSTLDRALNYKPGDKVCGYLIKEVAKIEELNLAAVRLEHAKTGADHLHLAREDKNNLFSVSFRTTPQNSTGVPHILEHLVLCGSEKFPCRDPFFKMLNRSLSTHMNAYTGLDSTMYPFSTQNAKDFENLLKVYLDAVFFPSLLEKDFRQEGWRLEHEDINDKSTPIIFKGVVFNEMKGVFTDSNQVYAHRLLNELYPSHTYAYVSGGEPLVIPELSLAELKEFHSKHYHPSNARFLTYGNFPLEIHLERIEEFVLEKFNKIKIENSVPDEKHWNAPREIQMHSRFDTMAAVPENQTTISNSYLMNSITDTYETFALTILGSLLIDGPNAPFYQSLLQPGIGPDYSPYSGYDSHQKQGMFSIGMREIANSDVLKVKDIIESTFDDVIKTGFPEERVNAFLHSIELGTKHQTSHFGLSCAMGLNALCNHDGNPIAAMKVNDHVKWFVEKMKQNPRFLQEKTEQYFRHNNHKLTLVMTPKETYEQEEQECEQILLQSKISQLSEQDKLKLYDDGIALSEYQSREEDTSCLPSLKIQDVQKTADKTEVDISTLGGVPIHLCVQPTNEVVYFRAVAKLPRLSEDLLMLLPLFASIATKMGAADRNFKEFDQIAELKTGGLSASVHISENPMNVHEYDEGIVFTSHCLEKNVADMFSLWTDIFNRLRLDDMGRLSQLIKLTATDLAQGILYQAHNYAIKRASSCLSVSSNIREKLSGLSQVSYMKKLAETDNYEETVQKFRLLSEILLQKNSLRCSINADSNGAPTSLKHLESFLNSISKKSNSENLGDVNRKPSSNHKTHFILPLSVNYLGKCLPTVPYAHRDFATLKTASKLVSSKFLHREIREKGSAYGGGSHVSTGGEFLFYSYRDPNVAETLNNFSLGSEWLLKGDYTPQDIDEAKLSIFGEIDKPVPPGAKGLSQFLYGITHEMKQELRDRLFSLNKEDIISVTNRYLINPKQAGIALIGPENELTKDDSWTKHKE